MTSENWKSLREAEPLRKAREWKVPTRHLPPSTRSGSATRCRSSAGRRWPCRAAPGSGSGWCARSACGWRKPGDTGPGDAACPARTFCCILTTRRCPSCTEQKKKKTFSDPAVGHSVMWPEEASKPVEFVTYMFSGITIQIPHLTLNPNSQCLPLQNILTYF